MYIFLNSFNLRDNFSEQYLTKKLTFISFAYYYNVEYTHLLHPVISEVVIDSSQKIE